MSSTGTSTLTSIVFVVGGADDVDRCRAAEEARDLVERPHGRRQADPLRRLGQQRVEPLQGQRQVRAALGRRRPRAPRR